MKKIKFKILKNNKKDAIKKSKIKGLKEINVCYPRFEAISNFDNKNINFIEHEFGTTYLTIDFKEKIKFPNNRIEYGEDFISSDEDLVILRYKYKGKDKIITSIEIIGNKKYKKK